MKILMLLSILLSGVSLSGISHVTVVAAHRSSRPLAGASNAGKSVWQWPLVGGGGSPPTVVRPFDPPLHRWLPGHRGVDLDARGSTQVLAAGPGTVIFAGVLFGEGVVVIEHHGVRTTYEPVRASVHAGDAVVAGTPIGTLAAGHCPTGACLHWGLVSGHGRGVRYYDPLLLVGRVRLRLEPLG